MRHTLDPTIIRFPTPESETAAAALKPSTLDKAFTNPYVWVCGKDQFMFFDTREEMEAGLMPWRMSMLRGEALRGMGFAV